MANNGFISFCENVWLIQSLEGHIVHLPVRKKYFPSGVFISKVPFLETLCTASLNGQTPGSVVQVLTDWSLPEKNSNLLPLKQVQEISGKCDLIYFFFDLISLNNLFLNLKKSGHKYCTSTSIDIYS